jgi:eukaryotic-like serine/threonine-protein kinase
MKMPARDFDHDDTWDALLAEVARADVKADKCSETFGQLGYRAVRCLGSGSFGDVYAVVDRHGRRRALKLLRRLDSETLYRFKREFRSAVGLRHPNLVRLYELEDDGGRWFFTMELIEGEELLDHVQRSPEALREAFGQLAAGVSALHAAGRLHRDLKPSNVLVEAGGRVVVVDFGLSLAPADSHATVAAGTPGYMAPEQCAGGELSEAADWYAVGVMLYEALSGQLPFEGSALEVIADKQRCDAPPLATVAPEVSADLARLCEQLLSREPSERLEGVIALQRWTEAQVPSLPGESLRAAWRPSLLGRDAQLDIMAAAFHRLRCGELVDLRLVGDSGIGKTSLAEGFLERIGGEALVLRGRCYECESLPFKAIDGVVDALARHMSTLPRAAAAALMPRGMPELAQMFPVLRGLKAMRDVSQRALPPDGRELRRRAIGALKELLARLGDERALVVFIDDLQWGDLDSMRVLVELLGPPDAPRMLLLTTHRPLAPDGDSALRELLRLRPEGYETLTVGPLPPAAARRHARRLLAASSQRDDVALTIAREAAGHPLLIAELSRHVDAVPAGLGGRHLVDAVIQARVATLPADRQELLELLCVAGHPLSPAGLAQALRKTDFDAMAALEQLESEHLLRRNGDGFEAYHDRVRESVTAVVPPARIKSHHERLAETLLADDWPEEQIARHFLEAGALSRAHALLVQAAERARESLAFVRAAELYRLALSTLGSREEPEFATLSERRGEALELAGHRLEAADVFLDAAARNADRARALRWRGGVLLIQAGYLDRGMAIIAPMLHEFDVWLPRGDLALRAALGLNLARIRLLTLRIRERPAAACDPVALARIDRLYELRLAINVQSSLLTFYLNSVGLIEALRQGERLRIADGLGVAGATEALDGRPHHRRRRIWTERLDAVLDEATAPAQLRGVLWEHRGALAILGGDFREATRCYDEAERLLREEGDWAAAELSFVQNCARSALMTLGDFAELARRGHSGLREAEERRDRYSVLTAHRVLVDVELAAGRPSEAAEHVDYFERHSQVFPALVDYLIEARMMLHLYRGEIEAAYAAARAVTFEQLDRETGGCGFRLTYCHLYLAASAVAARTAESLVFARAIERRCRRDQSRLRPPVELVIRAGIAWAEGQTEAAAKLYLRAAATFDAAELRFHAACARRRGGVLLGDARGERLVAEADRSLADLGVTVPARMCAAVIPGPPAPLYEH